MFSLHPVTIDDARLFLEACTDASSDRPAIGRGLLGLEWLERGDARGPELVGHALATFLAERQPSFVLSEISLTNWEAQIDRGVGMLMRPPARLLIDAGMERSLAQRFPIRLDPNTGMMAGAFVPAHLIPQLESLLEARLERQLRRLIEAEVDAIANMGLMLLAVAYARAHETGLIEATGVADEMDATTPVYIAHRKQLPKELRQRLEKAARPPKKPGLVGRLRGEREQPNGGAVDHGRYGQEDPAP